MTVDCTQFPPGPYCPFINLFVSPTSVWPAAQTVLTSADPTTVDNNMTLTPDEKDLVKAIRALAEAFDDANGKPAPQFAIDVITKLTKVGGNQNLTIAENFAEELLKELIGSVKEQLKLTDNALKAQFQTLVALQDTNKINEADRRRVALEKYLRTLP